MPDNILTAAEVEAMVRQQGVYPPDLPVYKARGCLLSDFARLAASHLALLELHANAHEIEDW